MNLLHKNLHQKSERILQTSLVLLLLLFGLVVGVAADQKKAPPAPRPSAPPPAHHASAPVSHAPASRPSTTTHSPNTGGRPGTSTGTRPGVGKTGTGTVGKTGTPGRTGTVNNNGRGPTGKTGNGSAMGKPGMGKPGGNMGKGGNGNVGKGVNRPAPGRQVSLKGGGTASIRPNGQIRSINRNGMHIDHGLNGTRRIESTHNGARIVTTGKNSGYVQRAYVTRGGRTYVSRTVVVNHVTYTSVYRSYSYGGYCCYYGYHPAFYYGPAYYGWAYNPWPAPVYYGWGWGGSPWYGYYGGYFAPYPTYPSAAFWLTDYLISVNLQAAYAARAAANAAAANNTANDSGNGGGEQPQDNSGGSAPADSGAVTLTPEVKAAIAEEVKAQLAAEQAAAKPAASSSGSPQPTQASEEVPPALDPARRTFVVSSDLTVTGDGQECQLTAGDVITRITDTPDDDRKVTVSVSSAKKADCAPGKQVAVAVDDLQEMHNHFQEQLDNGMKELSSKQGTGGLPKAPDTTPIASDVPPPPPDASAEKTLQDQQAAADQTEAQVVKEAFSQGS
jgi:hypothetical protein